MTNAIIGGAIAAVMGAVTALCIERYREKARQLAIVEALIIETAENLTICKTPITRKMWWWAPYKLGAYHAYKGQFFFLSEEVRIQLTAAAFTMEGANTGMQIHVSRVPYTRLVKEKPLPLAPQLIEQLEFVNEELRKWRWKHRGFVARLRNFISKIRKNSKLKHT